MIISGGSRRGARWFATHLMRTDQGQRVTLAEVRGLAGNTIPGWFSQMEAMAEGTRCENFFYHSNINPREDERLTDEQWEKATDTLERNLGLEGHSRFVVEHEKEGRIHRHIFWSRIDPDTMTAVSDSKTYRIHERTADALEKQFGHEPTSRKHGPNGRNPDNWEVFRSQKSRIDPKEIAAELTRLWERSDTGQALAAAIEEHGYILAEGNRGLCVVDVAGHEHSLARRIAGARKKDIDARMAAIDREVLPSVEEARALARDRATERRERDEAQEQDPMQTDPSPKRKRNVVEPELSVFERVAQEWKEALRSAGGEGLFIAEGIAWIASKLGLPTEAPPANREQSPFERVAEEVKQAMRDNGGEPYTEDGHSFWQRAVAIIMEARDKATAWVKEKANDLLGRFVRDRSPDRDDSGIGR